MCQPLTRGRKLLHGLSTTSRLSLLLRCVNYQAIQEERLKIIRGRCRSRDTCSCVWVRRYPLMELEPCSPPHKPNTKKGGAISLHYMSQRHNWLKQEPASTNKTLAVRKFLRWSLQLEYDLFRRQYLRHFLSFFGRFILQKVSIEGPKQRTVHTHGTSQQQPTLLPRKILRR